MADNEIGRNVVLSPSGGHRKDSTDEIANTVDTLSISSAENDNDQLKEAKDPNDDSRSNDADFRNVCDSSLRKADGREVAKSDAKDVRHSAPQDAVQQRAQETTEQSTLSGAQRAPLSQAKLCATVPASYAPPFMSNPFIAPFIPHLPQAMHSSLGGANIGGEPSMVVGSAADVPAHTSSYHFGSASSPSLESYNLSQSSEDAAKDAGGKVNPHTGGYFIHPHYLYGGIMQQYLHSLLQHQQQSSQQEFYDTTSNSYLFCTAKGVSPASEPGEVVFDDTQEWAQANASKDSAAQSQDAKCAPNDPTSSAASDGSGQVVGPSLHDSFPQLPFCAPGGGMFPPQFLPPVGYAAPYLASSLGMASAQQLQNHYVLSSEPRLRFAGQDSVHDTHPDAESSSNDSAECESGQTKQDDKSAKGSSRRINQRVMEELSRPNHSAHRHYAARSEAMPKPEDVGEPLSESSASRRLPDASNPDAATQPQQPDDAVSNSFSPQATEGDADDSSEVLSSECSPAKPSFRDGRLPAVEDGLSSSEQASDSEAEIAAVNASVAKALGRTLKANPTSALIAKQINEIDKEIVRKTQNQNVKKIEPKEMEALLETQQRCQQEQLLLLQRQYQNPFSAESSSHILRCEENGSVKNTAAVQSLPPSNRPFADFVGEGSFVAPQTLPAAYLQQFGVQSPQLSSQFYPQAQSLQQHLFYPPYLNQMLPPGYQAHLLQQQYQARLLALASAGSSSDANVQVPNEGMSSSMFAPPQHGFADRFVRPPPQQAAFSAVPSTSLGAFGLAGNDMPASNLPMSHSRTASDPICDARFCPDGGDLLQQATEDFAAKGSHHEQQAHYQKYVAAQMEFRQRMADIAANDANFSGEGFAVGSSNVAHLANSASEPKFLFDKTRMPMANGRKEASSDVWPNHSDSNAVSGRSFGVGERSELRLVSASSETPLSRNQAFSAAQTSRSPRTSSLNNDVATATQPVWVPRDSSRRNANACVVSDGSEGERNKTSFENGKADDRDRSSLTPGADGVVVDSDTDTETDRLLGFKRAQQQLQQQQYQELPQQDDQQNAKKRIRKKEVIIHEPAVLIEGVLFRARYLGSTQLICEGRPTKSSRMMQAQEAVARIKAPDGEPQPSTDVDLFISTEKIMVLNTDLQRISKTDVRQDIMMDHPLRTISYIADIGDLVVLMARRISQGTPDSPEEMTVRRAPRIICHVFESEEAQFIAQSIGQAFHVAYMEFLRQNGIDDPNSFRETDYQEVLNEQQIFGDELELFARKETQKDVVVPKQKGEILGIVIVESGWGSMLPTVVLANLMPGGPAARCNQLNIGDQIIAVNGISLVGLPLSACQTTIKGMKNVTAVRLTLVHTAPVVEVRIKRPDTKYQLGFSVQNGVCKQEYITPESLVPERMSHMSK